MFILTSSPHPRGPVPAGTTGVSHLAQTGAQVAGLAAAALALVWLGILLILAFRDDHQK